MERNLVPQKRPETVTQIIRTLWPKAQETSVRKALWLCRRYGLNPLMREVFIVEFRGKEGAREEVLLGITAQRKIAQAKTRYSYADGPRVMSGEEQKQYLGELDPANIWAITVLTDKDGDTYRGYGFWPRAQEPYGTDKGNSKINMAMKRSESNALARLCPEGLPATIDSTDAEYVDIAGLDRPSAGELPPPEARQPLETTLSLEEEAAALDRLAAEAGLAGARWADYIRSQAKRFKSPEGENPVGTLAALPALAREGIRNMLVDRIAQNEGHSPDAAKAE